MSKKEANPILSQGSDHAFRAMFERSADAMFVLDGDCIVDCNPAAHRLMKCSREVLLKTPLSHFSPEKQPDGQLSSQAMFEHLQKGYEHSEPLFEWTICTPEGETLVVEISLTAVSFDEQPLLFSIWRDITGRKKAETEVLDEIKLHRILFDGPPVGVAVIQDGVICLANKGMSDLTGLPAAELQGASLFDFIVPEERASVMENHQNRLAGKPAPAEKVIHILRKEGQASIPVNLQETVIPYRGAFATMGTFRNITERMRGEEILRTMVARRGYQAKVGIEIAQEMAAAPTVDELFTRVVTLVKERMGYYHTQLLRYEPVFNAIVLVKGYGEIGEKMLAMGHRLAVGRGLIGLCWATGTTVLRPDITGDPDWEPNPLLPDTKGEIALPIKYGDQVLGVLDVQSSQAAALTEDDRLLLESLCGQVAIFLESTRLRQEMQERLNELNNLYEGTTHEGWSMFRASSRLSSGYLFDRTDVHASETVWADEIEAAIKQKNLVAAKDENSATVAPLSVRGEVIGALGVYADPQRQLSEEDLALIEQVSDQVALALESARLFEQTSVALDEAEKLYNFSRNLAEAADLDAVVSAVAEAAGIPDVCRGFLITFEYNSAGDLTGGVVKANWFSGQGESTGIPVGTRYDRGYIHGMLKRFTSAQPVFLNDAGADARSRGIYSMAVLPLWVGNSQIGVIMLQTDSPHAFTDDEKRPMVSLAQQAAITIQSRLLFDQVTSSEARFRDISMSSADWVWEMDAQSRFTFCSERVKDVIGYTAAEMLGKTPFDYIVPEAAEPVRKVMTGLMANKAPIVDLENRIRAKNGQERTMLASGVPVLDDQGNLIGYRGVDRDITERKTLEAAILKDRAQLAEAMEAARMASWEFDVASETFVFNEAYYKFLETTLEEVGSYMLPAPEFIQKYIHPENVQEVESRLQQAVETADADYRSEFEARLRKHDGSYRSILISMRVEKDPQGKTTRLFGTNQDITERKQAQETIAKRAVELATVAEVATRVSTIQSPDEMLQTVVDLTKQAFNLYHVHIYLLNEAGTTLSISKGAGEIGRKIVAEGRVIPYNAEKSLVARAARNRQGVIVNNVKADPEFLSHQLLPDTCSEMAVPMIGGDRLLGVIDVQDSQVDRFTPEDVNIMTTLAAQIAVSLQNARSYARTQRQAEREALINAISERIQATNSVENALQVAVREIGRALGAQHTAIRLGLERKLDGE